MAENTDLEAGMDTEKTTTRRASAKKTADDAAEKPIRRIHAKKAPEQTANEPKRSVTTRRRVRTSQAEDENIPSISLADELGRANGAGKPARAGEADTTRATAARATAASTPDLLEPVTFDAADATSPAGDEPQGGYASFSSFVSELKGDGAVASPKGTKQKASAKGRTGKAAQNAENPESPERASDKPAKTRSTRSVKAAPQLAAAEVAEPDAEAGEKTRRTRSRKKSAEAVQTPEVGAESLEENVAGPQNAQNAQAPQDPQETQVGQDDGDALNGEAGEDDEALVVDIPMDEETASLVEKITHNIACQEQHVCSDEDVTPFVAHFQYGDGRVETCVIGASDSPAVFSEAEPERTSCFFRTCRHVQAQEDEDTPLPEEGFWIPPHPLPKTPPQPKQDKPLDNEAEGRRLIERAEAAAKLVPGGRQPRILVCWVGKVDISASLRQDYVNPGPIRMLLEHVLPFDFVVVLTAQNQNVVDTLHNWIVPIVAEEKLVVRRTLVHDLTDHGAIAKTAQETVEDIRGAFNLPENGEGIVFHLSPGSPVTHGVLLLLAATRYKGITLMSTKLNGVGKDPEIQTISMGDMLGDFVPDNDLPALHVTKPTAQPAEPKNDKKRPTSSLLTKPKHRFKPKEIIQRFRNIRGKSSSGNGAAQAAKEPRVQVVGMDGGFSAVDFEIPQAAHEENSLRAPQVSIGKPAKLATTALQPGPGDPPSISHALGEVYTRMSRVAPMYVPILLMGESGSGKSRLARFLHEWSGRSGKFVSLDCAGLTDEMFYVELFGRAGSPNARSREGAFRRARSGTLFLENVNRLTPTQQSMIVRILAPVGETKVNLPQQSPYPACQARVRIIASSSPTLLTDVKQGRFRTDLYYRLAGVSTMLPPVRDYTYEERENLLRSFLVALQQKLGLYWNFSGDAWQTLIDEKWPGNLREVSRILQQICLLSDTDSTISREQVLRQLRQGRVTRSQEDFEPMTFDDPEPAPQPSFAYDDLGPIMDGGPDMYSDEETGYIPRKKATMDNDFFVLGSGQNLDDTLSNMRMAKIAEAMSMTNGNRNEAAKLLGLSYVQLNYTLKHMHEDGEE